MHRIGAVALTCLLALAGCSAVPGGGGPATETGTLTPAPVPGSGSSSEQLAPGLSSEGVTDPLALANAHGSRLQSPYRFHSNWTVRYRNGSIHARADQRTHVTADGFRARVTVAGRPGFVTSGPRTTATFWSNGSVLAEQIQRDDRTRYRYLDAGTYNGGAGFYTSLRRPKPWRDHYALFTALETRVVDEVEVDGSARYTVVGERLRDPATFGAATDVRRPGNVSLRAVVTEQGVVRSLQLTYEGTVPTGKRVVVDRSIVYDRANVGGLERPPWFEAALNGSRNSRGSIPNP
jgi:hypothetical protein